MEKAWISKDVRRFRETSAKLRVLWSNPHSKPPAQHWPGSQKSRMRRPSKDVATNNKTMHLNLKQRQKIHKTHEMITKKMYKNGHLTYRNRYKIVPKSSKLPPRSLQKSPLEPCLEASWAREASKTALGANRRPPEGKNQVRGSLLGPQVGLQKSVFGVKNREKIVLKSRLKWCVHFEAF